MQFDLQNPGDQSQNFDQMRFGQENNSYLDNPFEAAIAKKVEQDKLAQIYYDS